jgi:hypothetical protein
MKESVMLRRFIITIATVAALGISFSSTNASAGGGYWHGGSRYWDEGGGWYGCRGLVRCGGWYECRGLFGCVGWGFYPVYDYRYDGQRPYYGGYGYGPRRYYGSPHYRG